MSYINRNVAIRLKCYDCNFSSVLFCYNGPTTIIEKSFDFMTFPNYLLFSVRILRKIYFKSVTKEMSAFSYLSFNQ